MRLTSRELLSITDFNVEAMKTARRRDCIALAFGGHDITANRMYSACDAVALMLSSVLARTYGATTAASLVRGITLETWRMRLEARSIFRSKNHSQEFGRIHNKLRSFGKIGIWNGFVWPVN